MKKKNKHINFINRSLVILILLLVLIVGLFGQKNDINSKDEISNNTKTELANTVLKKARDAIYKDIKPETIKSITLVFDFTKTVSLEDGSIKVHMGESKLFSNFSDQIRREEYSDFITNQQLYIEIFNNSRYSVTSDTIINGKPFYFGSNLSAITPKLNKEQRINYLKQTVFRMTFPLLLQLSLIKNLDFKYVGEGESKDFKADVIEIIIDKNDKKSRFFFDKESHLPVMMIQKFIHPITKKETERKTYYMDYKEVSGLLVAHKIIIQTGDTTTEERQLKKLEINPKFKPNLFEVKEDKINPF